MSLWYLMRALSFPSGKGFVKNSARIRVAVGNEIGVGVNRNRNATHFDNLKRLAGLATFGFGRVSFHRNTVPSCKDYLLNAIHLR